MLALLRGDAVDWSDVSTTSSEFLNVCEREDLHALAFYRITESPLRSRWPPALVDSLAAWVRRETAREMARREEIVGVLTACASAGIEPVLLKGTALAYTVYEWPACRPRLDTDLIIRVEDVEATRALLRRRGYASAVHCEDLFRQFEVHKTDDLGIEHVFDVHWKISTQPVFGDVLSYDELRARAVAAPALGPAAWVPCTPHALMLACVHPVMHHRNIERVLWIYDIHLLASALSRGERETFVDEARRKRVASICARGLRVAHEKFLTAAATPLIDGLGSAAIEASADYLDERRRWHDDVLSSLRNLPTVSDRLGLLKEIAFPNPEYILASYGLSNRARDRMLLPALYLHRHVRGAWRILSGRK